jgi:Protein of unknown function (DUF5672)
MARSRKARKLRRRTRKQRGGSAAHTAVMIETRRIKSLPLVLRSIFDNLDHSWNIMLFHGSNNKQWLQALIDKSFAAEKGRITLKDTGKDRIDIPEYNRMMMSREILDQIPTETFLVFQTDSILCKGHANLLKEFMGYDYVGAPWAGRDGVGNGGLSLRRKSVMLKIVDKCPIGEHNEDGYFSGGCDGIVPKKPSFDDAKRFSIETVYNPESFGIHKAWDHLQERDTELSAQCPGYTELKQLYNQED